MYSYSFNTNINSSLYHLDSDYNSRINTNQNSNKINSFYNGTNYNSNFNFDQEMSNIIHKFAEKVGATDDDEQQQQQLNQQQHQHHQHGQTSHGQQGRRGMQSTDMPSRTGQYQQGGMEGAGQTNMGGEKLGRDQYDLGRDRNDDLDMDDAMDMQHNMGASGTATGRGEAGMGTKASHMGQGQHQQYGSHMGSKGDSNTVGRGFKDDWETSETMQQKGSRQNRRDL